MWLNGNVIVFCIVIFILYFEWIRNYWKGVFYKKLYVIYGKIGILWENIVVNGDIYVD